MNDFFRVGVIANTHGIRGEVKVYPTTDDVGRFKNLKKVIRYDNKFIEPYIIMGLIYLKKNLYYSSKKSFEKAIRLDKGNKKVIEYYMIATGRAIKEKGK